MSQFMEVLEWFDDTGSGIVQRIPEHGSAEIKMGAQLIVRDNQACVFFKDGKGLDVFGGGRHTLTTKNLPILTKILSLPWGFTSPFRAEVYFVNLKTFINQKWGTKDPVAFKDSRLGLVRLRAFGLYTFRIAEPVLFIRTVVGTQGVYTSEMIGDYLRDVVVARINDLFGERLDSIFELPQQYDELALEIRERLTDDFSKYGMLLTDFFIHSITPPSEVQRMIDERSGLEAVGDLDAFFKFKAAKAMGDAAAAGGAGGAGAAAAGGMGVGVGAGLGMMIPGLLAQSVAPGAAAPAASAPAAAAPAGSCPKCRAAAAPGARFCGACGETLAGQTFCGLCGTGASQTARYCPNCGNRLASSAACPQCGAPLSEGAAYCTGCGKRLGAE